MSHSQWHTWLFSTQKQSRVSRKSQTTTLTPCVELMFKGCSHVAYWTEQRGRTLCLLKTRHLIFFITTLANVKRFLKFLPPSYFQWNFLQTFLKISSSPRRAVVSLYGGSRDCQICSKDQVKSSLVFGDIAYTVRIRCSDSGIFHAAGVTVAHWN